MGSLSLNLLDYPICLVQPKRRTPLLNWHEHIPFAFFLVDLLKPKVIVELGTHYGDSYCAFCQAVQELHLDTRCYAVDTWQGDPYSGHYGAEVLADLRAHHDPVYGGFSRLIESTFDEALRYFDDGTTDVLHIDGCHTFEAVSHDFESWLPKLSRRGVVLLHDINVREREFGVWKAWDKLKARFPHFEFWHSHGLGVLAVGKEQPPAFMEILQASSEDAAAVRRVFFHLGHNITLGFQQNALAQQIGQLQERERSLEASLQTLRGQAAALQHDLEQERAGRRGLEERVRSLEAESMGRDQYLATVRAEREAFGKQASDLQLIVQTTEQARHELMAELERLQEVLSNTEAEAERTGTQLETERREREREFVLLNEVHSGILWGVFSSLRSFKDRRLPPGTRRRQVYDAALGLLKSGRKATALPRSRNWVAQSFLDAARHPIMAGRTVHGLTRKAGQILAAEGPQRVLERASGKLQRWNSLGEPVLGCADALAWLNTQYLVWLERHALTADRLSTLKVQATQFAYQPRISIVMPVFNVAEPWLRRAITSVQRQVYVEWELCLVDDASTDPHVKTVVEEFASQDQRIKPVFESVNAGIAMASNKALSAASGEFVAFLDHDDELAPNALFEVVRLLNTQPDLDLIYSDEDKLDDDNRRCDPSFKPGWCPDLLLSMNYICHLTVIRKSMIDQVGGFRPGFDGSQDYDLLLRLTEQTTRIGHLPEILYHWRKIPGSAAASIAAKPDASAAACRGLTEALHRRNIEGTVEMISHGRYRVRYALVSHPLISIVIPTKDKTDLLARCLASIESMSTYRKYEVLIVDNGSEEESSKRYFREIAGRHKVLSYPHPFNWAAINNFASRHASGTALLFLNNDVEVIEPSWLEAMLEHAQRKDVGVVGAKLLFPSGQIQHAGAVLGIGGICGHAFKSLPGKSPGYLDFAKVVRNYSAVTGACMMTRTEVFHETGGFDENLRVAFSDIDFCLRVRDKGFQVVFTPYACLHHYESATRGAWHPEEDTRTMRNRWGSLIAAGDPFYNPNLTLTHEDFRLRL